MNDANLPATHAGTLLQQIERLVRSDVPVERMQGVLDLYNRERDRAQLEAFNTAMTKLQAEVYEISTSGHNPTFRTAYPKLHDLLKEARPIYTHHGFGIRYGSMLQKTANPPLREGWQRVVIIVSHDAGHWEEAFLDGPPDIQQGARARSPVQAIGSTTTYLRRYLFMMVLNLVPGGMPEDDDGSGGRDAFITPEQAEEIRGLASGTGLTPTALREITKVDRAEDIRAGDYTRVVNTLMSRQRKEEDDKPRNFEV